MEYCPQSLLCLIKRKKRIKESIAARYFWGLIEGLEYLHKKGISHRDIKPDNILLDGANNLKIIDFGLGNLYDSNQRLSTPCGSPCYAPPEVSKL